MEASHARQERKQNRSHAREGTNENKPYFRQVILPITLISKAFLGQSGSKYGSPYAQFILLYADTGYSRFPRTVDRDDDCLDVVIAPTFAASEVATSASA
jgi:hypothetical protein